MKKTNFNSLFVSFIFYIAFILWTIIVTFVDVSPVGPKNSSVGLSSLNSYFKDIIVFNMELYEITDWLGLLPVFIMLAFFVLGLVQLIRRRSVFRVDISVLLLDVLYTVIFCIYLFFENVIINYRPILINGHLEASYPSSTTLLVLTVIPSALIEVYPRIKQRILKTVITVFANVFSVYMVISRFISGVHWFSDIIGGILLSVALVLNYKFFCYYSKKWQTQKVS